jgi:hypothetical protein
MGDRITIPGTYVAETELTASDLNADLRDNMSNIDAGYGCRVATTTSQSISQNTWTALEFDAETFDDDTMHDNSTNNSRITIKSAGRYLVTGSALYAGTNSAGNRLAAIYVNGALYSYGSSRFAGGAANTELITICDVIDVDTDDYVEFYTEQTGGGLTVKNRHFSVTKYV